MITESMWEKVYVNDDSNAYTEEDFFNAKLNDHRLGKQIMEMEKDGNMIIAINFSGERFVEVVYYKNKEYNEDDDDGM